MHHYSGSWAVRVGIRRDARGSWNLAHPKTVFDTTPTENPVAPVYQVALAVWWLLP
ncbi:hypothetical protein GJ744_011880 [Endocarpon pusillum]|uniref:Uncharacterized protein n=1 Tax=Endocarpon pusillum TaxID=364733 RepID=A0A8H7E1U6_9EURO|nr:hypothetical protein GJ744_011880 [Endocarpon pusillum]